MQRVGVVRGERRGRTDLLLCGRVLVVVALEEVSTRLVQLLAVHGVSGAVDVLENVVHIPAEGHEQRGGGGEVVVALGLICYAGEDVGVDAQHEADQQVVDFLLMLRSGELLHPVK